MQFTGSLIGIAQVNRLFDKLEDHVQDAAVTGMAKGVLLGQSIVRGKARGRPGPRAITGNFNRSIVGDYEDGGDTIFGQIGTNAAQGRRLEYGFYGTDALGRKYDQPPYPYLGPSVPEVREAVENQIAKAIGNEIG